MASSTPGTLQLLRVVGLSQQEIQQQLGVDRVTLYRWEQGTHAPMTPELFCTLFVWDEPVRHWLQSLHS